jgi:outer membrane receptor for ferrienterochelin and colicin
VPLRRARSRERDGVHNVRRRNLARLTSALLASALLTIGGSAFGDARTEARSHFKKGMELISNGRYEEGISELNRAYEILPHANVLYNIGRAYAEAGDLESAVATYRRYLEGSPPDRDEVAQIITSLDNRIRRQQAAAAAAREATPAQPTPGAVPGTTPGTTGPAPTPVAGGPQTGPATTGPTVGPVGPEGAAPIGAVSLGQARTEDVFAETVVTASKGAQSPLEAPNSTSIITEQDIHLSGITKIPELLRRLAGVDIMETSGSQTEVSLRGFNQRLSNKILVLVNGRSVYVDLLGITIWQMLTIGVEDIERIEVVRGPGSALYGADAFNGVVNIITKAPGEGKDGINLGYGETGSAHGSFWATGRVKEFAYRASAGYDNLPRWSREVPPNRLDLKTFVDDQNVSGRTSRLDLRMTQQLGRNVTVGLGGGAMQGQVEMIGQSVVGDVPLANMINTDVTTFLNSKNFEARVFWNHLSTDHADNAVYIGQTTLPALATIDVLDAEAQYVGQFETGRRVVHDLHVGLNYRYKGVSWSFLDGFRFEHHYGLFAHDEVKLGDKFAIVGDYRLDYVPYYEGAERFKSSPRGTVLFHPTKQSTIRGTLATAFRTPTFLESYLNFPVQLPTINGGALGGGRKDLDPNYRVKSENIFTAELGYLNQESDYFIFDSAIFYNHATNLIQLADNRAITVGDVATGRAAFDPSTATFPIFYGGYNNQCQAFNIYGAELGVRTFPIEGLDIYANYTLNSVSQDLSGCTPDQQALLASVKDERTSMHKFNAGIQVRSKPGIDGSLDFHYVSKQNWAEQVANLQLQRLEYQQLPLDAYALVNARIGYRFYDNKADVSVVAFNLLDNQHREHPLAQTIGRRVMGYITYRF